MTGFNVVDQSNPATFLPMDANGLTHFDLGAGAAASNSSGFSSLTTTAKPLVNPNPPPPPNTNDLINIRNQVQRSNSIKKAMGDYDALSAATQAQGFQSAGNAGTSYANRLMQAGINPTSAGVVQAQSKLPVYSQLANIAKDKETTRLDAVNKAQTLAASIASTIGQINLGYTKTVADYNAQQSQYDLDLKKFNTSFGAQQSQQAFQNQLAAAQFARGGSSGSGTSIAPFSGMMTRAPNDAGGVTGGEFTPQFKEYLSSLPGGAGQAALLAGAPQYPADQGINSGSAIDAYNLKLRQLAHLADPRTPTYDEQILSPGARAPSFGGI